MQIQTIYSAGSRALRLAIKALKPKKSRKNAKYITGIHRGNFIRKQIKVEKVEPVVPKLPQAGPSVTPKPFKQVTHPPPGSNQQTSGAKVDFTSKIEAWLRQNGPVLILNFGSVCTLMGFTRQDILELRALSMSGSLSFVVYQTFQRPIRWLPIMWSCLFSTVNAYKISSILFERKASVTFNDEEEDIFVEHFMDFGVTPKQFEQLLRKAERKQFKRGEIILKQGEKFELVYLVIKGRTRAHRGGRRLSIVSSTPGNRENKIGGDSGAWAGEIAFLDWLWKMEQKPKTSVDENGNKDDTDVPKKFRALYSIVAKEECEVLQWKHEDLEKLLYRSTDMRAALTRAMTAAIASKVVNYTVSKSTSNKSWSTWLTDWKNSAASVNLVAANDDK